MRAWIDIDNPPQVQYLAPFVDAFKRLGIDVIVTARDYGITLELLRARNIEHRVIGHEFGGQRLKKLGGTAARGLHLAALVSRGGRPAFLLSTSRSGAMAAWLMRLPSFMILDYEHAELRSFRTFGTTIIHPDAIDAAHFRAKGFDAGRVWAFDGIKEDITFAGRDIDAIVPHDFGVSRQRIALVLVRPPSETSHYFNAASRELSHAVLGQLAAQRTVRVVFSPRSRAQVEQLGAYAWSNEPIVLERPVEFASLLKSVDGVVCAGGTMLREAAYLGVPAISIFRGETGAVDQMLERRGAVRFVDRAGELDDVDWRMGRRSLLAHNPQVLDELAARLAKVGRGRAGDGGRPEPD